MPDKFIKPRQVEAIPLSLEIALTGCKDYEVHKLKIEHLTEKVDKGFESVRGKSRALIRIWRMDLRGLTVG